MSRYILVAVGILFVLNTISVLLVSNFNFGALFPALVGILIIIYSIFRDKIHLFSQNGIGKIIYTVTFIGLLFFIVTFIFSIFIILNNSKKYPSPNAQAIIVLGAGLNGDTVSLTLSYRLDKAAEYSKNNPQAVIVVSGGQGADETVTESYAMKKYLISLGVSEDKIICEDKSSSTYENFKFSKVILDNYFGSSDYRIVYVTNDFHIFRSGMIAKDIGFEAEGLSSPSNPGLIPNYYIREYFSLIKYFVFG